MGRRDIFDCHNDLEKGTTDIQWTGAKDATSSAMFAQWFLPPQHANCSPIKKNQYWSPTSTLISLYPEAREGFFKMQIWGFFFPMVSAL